MSIFHNIRKLQALSYRYETDPTLSTKEADKQWNDIANKGIIKPMLKGLLDGELEIIETQKPNNPKWFKTIFEGIEMIVHRYGRIDIYFNDDGKEHTMHIDDNPKMDYYEIGWLVLAKMSEKTRNKRIIQRLNKIEAL